MPSVSFHGNEGEAFWFRAISQVGALLLSGVGSESCLMELLSGIGKAGNSITQSLNKGDLLSEFIEL